MEPRLSRGWIGLFLAWLQRLAEPSRVAATLRSIIQIIGRSELGRKPSGCFQGRRRSPTARHQTKELDPDIPCNCCRNRREKYPGDCRWRVMVPASTWLVLNHQLAQLAGLMKPKQRLKSGLHHYPRHVRFKVCARIGRTPPS